MKKLLLTFVLVAVMTTTLGLAGCTAKAKSGQPSEEHPSKAVEHPSKAQPESEHPTEHPR